MDIDIPDSEACQRMLFDEQQHLRLCGDCRMRQVMQCRKDRFALPKMPERNFPDDERMGQYVARLEQCREYLVAIPQMIHPNGRIDKDQQGFARRRGAIFALGSVPPRCASRRALSRSINAFRASRTRADFSSRPVNARALARSSSSRAIVVRMIIFLKSEAR
jgi:hypothetical protein